MDPCHPCVGNFGIPMSHSYRQRLSSPDILVNNCPEKTFATEQNLLVSQKFTELKVTVRDKSLRL